MLYTLLRTQYLILFILLSLSELLNHTEDQEIFQSIQNFGMQHYYISLQYIMLMVLKVSVCVWCIV